ncbi:hypothetical protein KR009_009361, partial [Drosophila setifemur]
QLLCTLAILALALVQACQIHHNLTFPAANGVSGCSANNLGHHLRYRNQSLTRDLPTLTSAVINVSPPHLELCYFGQPFTLRF